MILISILAPHTGSDERQRRRAAKEAKISIHAPHTGSDGSNEGIEIRVVNFNPRSPHGERRELREARELGGLFQSTLPTRGATRRFWHLRRWLTISIHAPHTGSDIRLAGVQAWRDCISIHAPHTGSDAI